MDYDDLDNRFDYHPPKDAWTRDAHQIMRASCRQTAGIFNGYCPDSRELSLAVTKIEEAMMWANAAIARHGARPSEGGSE